MSVIHLYIIHPVVLHIPINYQSNTGCVRLIIDWFIPVIQEYDFDLGSGYVLEVRPFAPYDQ